MWTWLDGRPLDSRVVSAGCDSEASGVRSCIAHGGTATAKVREAFVQAIKTLGYCTGDWSRQFDAFRVPHLADVAGR